MADKIPNPFVYSTDPELNTIFDKLIALQARVADKFAKAEKIAGLAGATSFVKLQDVETKLPNYRYLRDKDTWRKPSLAEIDKIVQAAIIETREKIAAVEAANAPLVAQNNELAAQVTEMMRRIGIPDTYITYEYPTSRSRTKKSISHSAGYIGDLQRCKPASNVGSKKYELESYINDYNRWVASEKSAEEKANIERDEHIVQTKILGNPHLVATLMKADVNILSEVQKAVPGKKADVIEYCIAQAIKNVQSKPDIDEALLEQIEDLV